MSAQPDSDGSYVNTNLPFDRDYQLKRAQIEVMHANFWQLVAGQLFCVLLFCYFNWGAATARDLIIFAAFTVGLLAVRIAASYRHARLFEMGAVDQAIREMMVLAFVAGCLWGIAGSYFTSQERLIGFALNAILLMGLTSVSLPSYSCYPPLYYVFALPTIVPFIIFALFSGIPSFEVIGLGLIFVMALNTSYCRSIRKIYSESVTLRFENIDLVAQLRQEKDQIEKSDRAKSRFLAASSHDLRQPLHALSYFHTTLRQRLRSEDLKPLFAGMDQARHALVDLFDGIFDKTRIELNQITPNPVSVHVGTAVASIANELRIERVALDDHIADAACFAYVDPLLFARILRNILSNAVKFAGSPDLVEMRARTLGNRIEIVIADEGPGIPAGELSDIFSDYFRGTTPEGTKSSGAGLGLAIVRELCTLMDIDIAVRSELGQGAAFALTLDRSQAFDQHLPFVDLAQRLAPLTGRSVLVLDDDPQLLALMSNWVSQTGLHPVAAQSIEDMRKSIADLSTQPCLIITDYSLSQTETGFDAVQMIEEEFNAEFPKILVSGTETQEVFQRAQAEGFVTLEKPFSVEAFTQVIASRLLQDRGAGVP